MGLKITTVALTTSYAEAFTIRQGTVEVMVELAESDGTETIYAFVDSIGGVSTGLSEGGASSAGEGWSLKFSTTPVQETIVVHAKASTGLSAILSVWTK